MIHFEKCMNGKINIITMMVWWKKVAEKERFKKKENKSCVIFGYNIITLIRVIKFSTERYTTQVKKMRFVLSFFIFYLMIKYLWELFCCCCFCYHWCLVIKKNIQHFIFFIIFKIKSKNLHTPMILLLVLVMYILCVE